MRIYRTVGRLNRSVWFGFRVNVEVLRGALVGVGLAQGFG